MMNVSRLREIIDIFTYEVPAIRDRESLRAEALRMLPSDPEGIVESLSEIDSILAEPEAVPVPEGVFATPEVAAILDAGIQAAEATLPQTEPATEPDLAKRPPRRPRKSAE